MTEFTKNGLISKIKKKVKINVKGCWIYQSRGPYTNVMFKGTSVSVRRFCYTLLSGRKDAGDRRVECTCHNPSCVNPEHLELGVRTKSEGGIGVSKVSVRYPWGEWFLKKSFQLKKDKDFVTSMKVMKQVIRNSSVKYGVSVSLSVVGYVIKVQVFPRVG